MATFPAGDPTAVFGRRVLAALIDAALVIVPAVLVLTASFQYLDVVDLDGGPDRFCDAYLEQVDDGVCLNLAEVDDRVYFTEGISGASAAVYWGGTFFLLVLLQGITGWTPGKLLMGIRTVGEDGRRAGLMRCLVRWVMWIVDSFPYVLPLLGFIVGLTTQGHRRVGDMVAKTFVVRRAAMGSPIAIPGVTSAPPLPGGGPVGPVGPAVPPPTGPPPTFGAVGPQWDAARNTYIHWDADRGQWLAWDEGAHTWSPIADS